MTEDFEERAAIYEYDAGMTRKQAETQARMKGCSHCGRDQLRESFKFIRFASGRGGREICGACFERRRQRIPSV